MYLGGEVWGFGAAYIFPRPSSLLSLSLSLQDLVLYFLSSMPPPMFSNFFGFGFSSLLLLLFYTINLHSELQCHGFSLSLFSRPKTSFNVLWRMGRLGGKEFSELCKIVLWSLCAGVF